MSVVSWIGGALRSVYGAVGVVVGIGKQMLPFVRAAREIVPDVDAVCDRLEAKLQDGGEDADAWLDKNLPALEALDNFFAELAEVAAAGRDVTTSTILYSQVETPEILEVSEGAALAVKINRLRAALVEIGTRDDIESLLADL